MKLDGFDIFVVDVPRRAAAPTGSWNSVRSILVRMRDESGIHGWGESPLEDGDEPGCTESSRDTLRDVILPALAAFEFDSLGAVATISGSILGKMPPASFPAFCGAELALLDMAGRRLRRNAGDPLGALRRPMLYYSGILECDDEAALKKQAAALRHAGTRDARLRVGRELDDNLTRLDVVRGILGADVELRICADGCWDPDEALVQLEAMARFRLAGVEQPVPGTDVQGLAAVTRAGLAPVIARDGVVTAEDVMRLAAAQACDAISISLSRCGGLVNAARLHQVARNAGIGCLLGASATELGLVAAAGRILVARSEGIRYCDFAPCLASLEERITDPAMAPDLAEPSLVPKGHGLGIRVLETAMEPYVSQRISVS